MDGLNAAWKDFSKAVMPKDASMVQLAECRRAFMAGASSLLIILDNLPDDATDEQLKETISVVAGELDRFYKDVKRGMA